VRSVARFVVIGSQGDHPRLSPAYSGELVVSTLVTGTNDPDGFVNPQTTTSFEVDPVIASITAEPRPSVAPGAFEVFARDCSGAGIPDVSVVVAGLDGTDGVSRTGMTGAQGEYLVDLGAAGGPVSFEVRVDEVNARCPFIF
jgi:hypothetical protein